MAIRGGTEPPTLRSVTLATSLGDLSTAVGILPRGAHSETAPAIIRVLAFAVLALAHAELGQHDRSFKAAQEAMEVVETRSMQALPQISLAFTAFGQSQAASGKLEEAMATLEHGLALRRKAPALSPWPTNAPPPRDGPSRHHGR